VEFSGFDYSTQVIERTHLEPIMKEFYTLWPKSRQSGNLTQLAGQLFL